MHGRIVGPISLLRQLLPLNQLKHRQFDLRIMCLLKRHLHTIAKLDLFYPLSDQPAFHDDAFVQYHVDVADRHFLFESRVTWHPHPCKAVDFTGPRRLEPLDVAAEAIHANDAREKLQLATTLALLD